MIFAEIAVGLLLIIVYAEAQKFSCRSTCKTNFTQEKAPIQYTCQLEDSINRSVVLTWYQHSDRNGWQERLETPRQVRQYYTTRRDFSANAAVPSVAPHICSVTGVNVSEPRCQIQKCDILYSVRNVLTWPLLYASPDEEITCKADGNPEPSFEWEWKNEASEKDAWMTVPGETEETIKAFLNNGTSIKLRCVAKNSFNRAESAAVIVSKDGAATRTGIIVGVIVAVVILAIVAGVVYKFCFDD